jgi:hypothetical protein
MESKSALHFPCPSPLHLHFLFFFPSFLSGQFEILRNSWCNHHHPMPDRTPSVNTFSQKVPLPLLRERESRERWKEEMVASQGNSASERA